VNRRNFLSQCLNGFTGVIGYLVLSGIPPPPPVPLPYIQISVDLIFRGQRIRKNIMIQKGQTVIDAIKKAFSYSHNILTTIHGISGHFKYSVNNQIPQIYAGNFQLNFDSQINITLM
jgi:hypothetical protein